MPKYLNLVARDLMKEHPGIPTEQISVEICKSFVKILKDRLIQEGSVHLDNLGKIFIHRRKGSESKRNNLTGELMRVPPKNVVKFAPVDDLIDQINIDRPKVETIKPT